jgi:uncharacterized membrane protein YphA (DoxX/SURF4 family)
MMPSISSALQFKVVLAIVAGLVGGLLVAVVGHLIGLSVLIGAGQLIAGLTAMMTMLVAAAGIVAMAHEQYLADRSDGAGR